MSTVLEARAVITAEDKTAAAFTAIEQRINRLSKAAAQVGNANRSIGAFSHGISSAGAELNRTSGAVARVSNELSRLRGLGSSLASIALPLGAAATGAMAFMRR